MSKLVMVHFLNWKVAIRSWVCVLSVFLMLGVLSCNSSPTASGPKKKSDTSAADAEQQKQIPFSPLQINFVDTVSYALTPNEARVLNETDKNQYVLEFPVGNGTNYRQIWEEEARTRLADAVSRYVLDEHQNRLGTEGTHSFSAYATIDSKTEWYDDSTKSTLSAEPKVDLGYIVSNGVAYFLITQRDSPVVGDTTGLRSSRITFCVNLNQVRELMNMFNLRFIEKPLLVFLGENVTAGHNVVTQEVDDPSKAYPAILQERLKINVLNISSSWYNVSETLERVPDDVMRYDPDVVVIHLGLCDFNDRIDPAETSRNLQSIINILKEGDRKIYLVRFYDERILRSIMGWWELTELQQRSLLTTYDTMFRNLSRNNNIDLITDIWEGLEYEDTIGEDFTHPTAEGQKIMAGNIFRAMRPYLEANNFLK